ncbi:MAG: YihY/virulence factor BrkB family protein [Syntrophorhabdus sp.]
MISKIVKFLHTGIWKIEIDRYPPFQAWCLRILRVIVMAAIRFEKDDCRRGASVLTYYSLLNIVPLFAVLFAIAKAFGLEKLIVRQIMQFGRDSNWQADITTRIIDFSRSLLAHARGEIIVGFGVIILFWTVISILGLIETSFNTIWEAKQSRSIVRKLTDYLSMIVLAPIFFALWSSINVLIVGEVKGFISDIGFIGDPLLYMLRLLPYISICVLLFILYMVMPNTRIPVRSAVIAALVSGILIQLVQWAYIKFQIGVATQSAIYGSFAAIPLFLAYLQISWTIVLFGAEIASAVENQKTYGYHPDFSRIGIGGRRLLMLRIFHMLVKTFEKGQAPVSTADVSRTLRMPQRFAQHILNELSDADLVSEITKSSRIESQYQPEKTIAEITIKQVMDAYEKTAQVDILAVDEDDTLALSLKRLLESMESSPANLKIKEI